MQSDEQQFGGLVENLVGRKQARGVDVSVSVSTKIWQAISERQHRLGGEFVAPKIGDHP